MGGEVFYEYKNDLVIYQDFFKQYKIHLLHNLEIMPESKICSCAQIEDWMGLQMGGRGLYDHIKECAKVQLIWIVLDSTSFTKPFV